MGMGALSFGQIFVGACQATYVISYTYQFRQYMRPKGSDIQTALCKQQTDRDRLFNRVTSGITATGSVARLVDWVVAQKWLVVGLIQVVALKILAHVTGIFFYLKNCIDIIESIHELDKIAPPQRLAAYDSNLKDSFDLLRYSRYLDLVASSFFGVYSGLQLGTLIVGAAILSPTALNFLMVVGCTAVVGAAILRLCATDAVNVLDKFRAMSLKDYGFV